jgi:uncharacterized membrane protein
MTIAFLPFLTSLLGEYSEEQVSVVIYIANAALSSMLLISIPWYATASIACRSSTWTRMRCGFGMRRGWRCRW